MPIVFEEEQRDLEKDQEIAEVRNVSFRLQNYATQPVWEKIFMLFFAIVCVAGAVAIQFFYNPFAINEMNATYREDVTEAELRLIPAQDRAAYLNSLPSRRSR